jgi:hypothetical protein
MCVDKTSCRVRVGKHLSDILLIKNGSKKGDTLSPLFFSFALEYAIRRVRVYQDGLKLNGTHQLLFDADGVKVVGGSVHTILKNTDLVVVNKEMGLGKC